MLFRIGLGRFSRCFRWVTWFSGLEACTPPPMCGVFWPLFFSELPRFCPGIGSGRRVFRVSFDGWGCFHRRTYDPPSPFCWGCGRLGLMRVFPWDGLRFYPESDGSRPREGVLARWLSILFEFFFKVFL